MTNINLDKLQTFLNKNEIPKIKNKPKTFLGIAKQPHYENVLSNIYAFYFNQNEVHEFKDLFFKSLLELINNDAKYIETFFDFEVDTEYSTNKGGRIDLLLSNRENAIIIENKVYHHLNNNLDDYWDSIAVENNNTDNKIGIVLSLQPVSDIKHPHFINITHLQLLQGVMNNVGNYILNANDKYVVFLKDLYQNIINLSKPIMEKKELEFYYKNQTEINQLVQFKENAYEHIVAEVEEACLKQDGLKVVAPRTKAENQRLRYYTSHKHTDLMLTIGFDDLLNNKQEMYMAVELMGNALKDRTIYNNITVFTEDEKKITFSDNFKNTNYHWAHFAIKHFHPTDHEIANLSEFIVDKLKEDHLMSIFKKLETFLDTNKN